MVQYLILCRSLTYAQKAARALERVGITASIMRVPKEIGREGCAYCVKVSERRFEAALSVLKNTETRITRVVLMTPEGELREVPL